MTPFDSYFVAKIAHALTGAPPAAMKLARASAADIWNAALDAANEHVCGEANTIFKLDLDKIRARVTPETCGDSWVSEPSMACILMRGHTGEHKSRTGETWRSWQVAP